ncbi:hypothetical protein GUJ93_ZPchr0010g11210 [Zizania palustris]|uniref:Uncharacterized protein n=1 Tax=Zizania palustris TaxID=103762 RepID=A0A8J5TDV4_ZIZPA|nr:hypothetical protein GUJ93_ZPchr0010g11210 [Zizania palustris]
MLLLVRGAHWKKLSHRAPAALWLCCSCDSRCQTQSDGVREAIAVGLAVGSQILGLLPPLLAAWPKACGKARSWRLCAVPPNDLLLSPTGSAESCRGAR